MKVLAIDIGGTHVKILATGSTQHSARTQLVLKTKAKITRYARSAETLPWLGFEQVQPTGRLSQVASTYRDHSALSPSTLARISANTWK
jgi:hypothetical protein